MLSATTTRIIASQELYTVTMPYWASGMARVRKGIVMKLIPLLRALQAVNQIAAFAPTDNPSYLLSIPMPYISPRTSS